MLRNFLLIVLFGALYVVSKRFFSRSTSGTKKTGKAEKIVRCSRCGLHIPENESHVNEGLIICGQPDCRNVEKQDGN